MDFGTPFHREQSQTYKQHLSLTSFTRSLHYHVHTTISKDGDHQKIRATTAVSAFMPVQAGQNLHELNSGLAEDESGILQIVPPRMTMFLS